MNKIISVFTFLLIIFSNIAWSQSDFMKKYIKTNSNQDKNTFIKNFPYDQYLNSVAFTSFKSLQKDRYVVYRNFGDGDDFLYYLAENFIKNYPVTLSNISKKIDIGESYLSPNKGFNRGTDEIYQIIGYYILNKIAQTIQIEITSGKFDTKDANNIAIIKRLEANKVFIPVEESTITKIKNRGVSYVIGRAWLTVKNHFARLLGKYATAGTIIILLILVILILIEDTRIFGIIALIVFIVLPLFFSPYVQGGTTTTNQNSTANFKLSAHLTYYPINTKEFSVNIYKVLDNQTEIGQAVWLVRPHISTSYFAYQNVPQKFWNFKSTNSVVLATTGGFTNNQAQPEGLTVENGNIVNAVLMPDRHGLITVQNGGINVINLKKSTIRLKTGTKTSIPIDNPLYSIIAYSQLLKWCRDYNATLFQTQLLAYSDSLLIDPNKAKPELRERRILILVSDKKGVTHHIIFNLLQPQNLAVAAKEIYSIFASRNMKIEAMLNFDVGMYNILNVYDDSGNLIQDVKGTVDINNATNLLIYEFS